MTLDELEAIVNAATPGPWKYDWGNWAVEIDAPGRKDHRYDVCQIPSPGEEESIGDHCDGEFIAAMRNKAERLIAVAKLAYKVQKPINTDAEYRNYALASDQLDKALKELEN
jgi:hypothetical protein